MSGKKFDQSGQDTDSENDHLHCCHCKQLLVDPVLLTCLHSVCQECARMLIGSSQPRDQFSCPRCKDDIDIPEEGIRGFPFNFFTQGLVSVYRAKNARDNRCKICELQKKDSFATFVCLNCGDFLCEECSRAHCLTRLTLEHNVTPLSELANGVRDSSIREMQIIPCSVHAEERIRYYCETCSTPICRECQLELHVGHTCAPVAASQKSRRTAISNMVENVNHKLGSLKKLEDGTDVNMKDIDKREKDLIDGVEKTTKKLLDQIEREKKAVIENLKLTMNNQRQSCEERKERIRQFYSIIEDNVTFCKDFVGNAKDEEVLFLEAAIRQRLKSITTKNIDSSTALWKPPDVKFRNLFMDVDRIGLFELVVARPYARLQDQPLQFGARHVSGLRLIRRIKITAKEDIFECRATGIAMFYVDHIIVGDVENRKIKIFTKMGTFVETIAHFKPSGIAVCGDAIGCTDSMSFNLYSNDKTIKKKISLESTGSTYPITALQDRYFVIADTRTVTFQLYSRQGELINDIIPEKNTNLKNPVYIAANSKGQIIVSDWMANCVIIMDQGGKTVKEYRQKGKTGKAWLPGSICVDQFDNIFVSDFGRNRIVVLSPLGEFMFEYSTRVDNLDRPRGMSCDGQGNVYVSGKGGFVNVYSCDYS